MPNEKKEDGIPVVPVVPQAPVQETELQKKAEQKANLDKAILEAQETLRKTREATKLARNPVIEEELPQIDLNDPSAKAWDKRIQDTSAPYAAQLEAQKNEVRTFALRRFLQDKPSLAQNQEKLKELMSNYDRLKVATEQTQEGVLLDLEKAYGATFVQELTQSSRDRDLNRAREDALFSEPGISRGANGEISEQLAKRQYTAEERKILEQWTLHGAPEVD